MTDFSAAPSQGLATDVSEGPGEEVPNLPGGIIQPCLVLTTGLMPFCTFQNA